MKVVAVKGIEQYSNVWLVHYTRQTAKGARGAVFMCSTPAEALEKALELQDSIEHHDGVYIGSKEKRKIKTSSRGR
jgi:hypothetical protein